MGKRRGAYQRRGTRKFNREEHRAMDETNAALWGRKLRAKLDAFLESRGLSHEPISDSYIATSSGDESDGPVEMLGG